MSEKWVDYDFNVGAWNLQNFGNYHLETWIDGGDSVILDNKHKFGFSK